MTPPRTILGTVIGWRWVRDPWRRRSLLLIGLIVLAFLSVWPRVYVAKAALMPEDNSGGLASILSGAGGTLASLGSLIGGRQSIEADLTIARSLAVAQDAAGRLKRDGYLGGAHSGDIGQAAAVLRHRVVAEAIRGSILQLSVTDRDPAFAKAAVSDFADALRSRLQALDVTQTGQKKAIAANRMAEATLNLARAQSALDRFRLANRLAEPQIELGAAISLVTGLQARLQAEESQLATLEKFATDDNIQVQASRSQIEALKNQITKAQADANLSSGPSVGLMSPKISEYENLYRDEKYAEAEYDVYKRYLDTVTVEQLSSTITMNMEEPPYIDPDRQFNPHAVAALILLILAGVLAEFYLAQPPPGWSTREAR
jgi:uncharacterized protein involved in exopolysaccharide biosynthesis